MSCTDDHRLIDSYYQDLNGEVLSMTGDDEALVVSFECDDWNHHSQEAIRRRFQIKGEQIIECTLRAPYRMVGDLYSTSGMLIEDHYSSEWKDVYWKSMPRSAAEVIGRLYLNHEEISKGLKDLREYLVAGPQTLKSSSGLLLHGPAAYAISQADSIRDLMEVYTISTHRQPKTAVGIGIDDSYMICHSIVISESALG